MLAIAVALLASSSLPAVAARAVRCDEDATGEGPQPPLSLLSQLDPLPRPSRAQEPAALRGGALGDVLHLRGGRLADGQWVNWDGKPRSGSGRSAPQWQDC